MSYNTLVSSLWTNPGALRFAVSAVAGSLLVALAAQVYVPMYPVPMTLQTLAVLVVGAALGLRAGAAAMVLYALEGAIGLPVFAEMKSGLPVLLGPTGGYILGFVLAAALVGYLAERGLDRSIPKMFLAMIAGAVVLYVPGLLWLAGFVGGLEPAITFGLAPFWLGDLIKATIAALAFPMVWRWVGN